MAADLSLPLETLITAAASKANGWLGDPPPRGYDKPPTPSAPSGMAVREIYIPSGVTVDNQPDVDNQPEAKLPSFELQILRLRCNKPRGGPWTAEVKSGDYGRYAACDPVHSGRACDKQQEAIDAERGPFKSKQRQEYLRKTEREREGSKPESHPRCRETSRMKVEVMQRQDTFSAAPDPEGKDTSVTSGSYFSGSEGPGPLYADRRESGGMTPASKRTLLPQPQRPGGDMFDVSRGARSTISARGNKGDTRRSRREQGLCRPRRESRRLAGYTPEYERLCG
ncbi:predicted protein [Histoplasma capsulatum G186AR]|uniref:Uncharacterized protein n=1 Tax=Ajellomyces capsulatus (strain G186AR / H82 / ATCC MYA-2454 / RMSCC 2432) TaxID=447093 RepID=C0NLA1_AJECG|nr:uncharacterized protein HCBG_03931 [Histoplasma capsulatum G186AR]EEH08642.1 predicted protein [Histoplasma capsulatum G186AR]